MPVASITSFKGRYRFLSNFWPVDIIFEDFVYPSVEHAYQAAKTTNSLFRKAIRRATSPRIAKRLGRTVPIRSDWDEIKLSVMRDLLRQKFKGGTLHTRLRETVDVQLIEGNYWGDTFWGVCKGKGENHLGKLLMEIRDHGE